MQPAISITPAEGFDKVGELHYNPQEVTISGPRMWVRDLREISTQEIAIEDADEPISDQVDLALPEGYNLVLSREVVLYVQEEDDLTDEAAVLLEDVLQKKA